MAVVVPLRDLEETMSAGGTGGGVFLHTGFHRRSRMARRVIVPDRVRANLLVAREVGGGAWGKRAYRGEGACNLFH